MKNFLFLEDTHTHSLMLPVLSTLILFVITLFSFPSQAMTLKSGELHRYLKAYDYGTKADNLWQQPQTAQLNQFGELFSHFHQQNWPTVEAQAALLGYQLVQFSDTETDKTYYILEEEKKSGDAGFIGGGTYVLNPIGLPAALQAPHPKRDMYTGTQAIDAFLYTQSKVLMLAGTRRDSSHHKSGCTGSYHASDVAHQDASYFHKVHTYLSEYNDEMVFIQYHGFGSSTLKKLQAQCNTTNTAMLNISESVRYFTHPSEFSIMHLLRAEVEQSGQIEACVYGNDTTSIGGTWNVQGRETNLSEDVCHKNADASSKRFIHLEQSFSVRKYHRKAMQSHLKTALTDYFNL